MPSELAKEIALGRHDDDLPEIVEAVGLRAVERRVEVRWRLTFGDLVIDEENLTLDELVRVEELTGKTWLTLDPKRSARAARAFILAALESREGLSPADAAERLSDVTAHEVGDGVSEYAVADAPFDSASESSS